MDGPDMGIVMISNQLSCILMYIFYALFKVSDARIRISRTPKELDMMM